jgi:hypothetical protein
MHEGVVLAENLHVCIPFYPVPSFIHMHNYKRVSSFTCQLIPYGGYELRKYFYSLCLHIHHHHCLKRRTKTQRHRQLLVT